MSLVLILGGSGLLAIQPVLKNRGLTWFEVAPTWWLLRVELPGATADRQTTLLREIRARVGNQELDSDQLLRLATLGTRMLCDGETDWASEWGGVIGDLWFNPLLDPSWREELLRVSVQRFFDEDVAAYTGWSSLTVGSWVLGDFESSVMERLIRESVRQLVDENVAVDSRFGQLLVSAWDEDKLAPATVQLLTSEAIKRHADESRDWDSGWGCIIEQAWVAGMLDKETRFRLLRRMFQLDLAGDESRFPGNATITIRSVFERGRGREKYVRMPNNDLRVRVRTKRGRIRVGDRETSVRQTEFEYDGRIRSGTSGESGLSLEERYPPGVYPSSIEFAVALYDQPEGEGTPYELLGEYTLEPTFDLVVLDPALMPSIESVYEAVQSAIVDPVWSQVDTDIHVEFNLGLPGCREAMWEASIGYSGNWQSWSPQRSNLSDLRSRFEFRWRDLELPEGVEVSIRLKPHGLRYKGYSYDYPHEPIMLTLPLARRESNEE